MGVEASYSRISPEKFAQLKENPEVAEEFLLEERFAEAVSVYDENLEANGIHFSLEKEWQALHFFLTGEVGWDAERSQTEPPARNVVMGGTPIKEWEATYDVIRFLTLDEVKAVARFLNEMPRETLRANFDARGSTKIYKQETEWNEEDWEILMNAYAQITKFYNQAAVAGEIVLLSFD